ncbi:MAG: hypothetical protein CME70_14120 [Halobacteriovorax sp.]|nr:hypothetical protein [Halobacteriovorax sp.]|tara:strand:+ start:34785 stop:35576 length:792 start_codon:yes stop_codon:yes gene_type:complete
MTRKSRELRLSETQALIAGYTEVGLENSRNCRFAIDMEYRLRNGRGLSPKRRAWLDSIIEQGVPEAKSPELVAKITESANLDGMQHRRKVMLDFASKIRMGWDLSEKQQSWLDNMMAEAKKIQLEGKWIPSDELIEKLRLAIRIAASKNEYYFQHRVGTAKAYEKVNSWINWKDRAPSHQSLEEPHLDEWACNKLLKAFKKIFEELDNPSHVIGDMRYYKGQVALIADAPYVTDRGQLVYPTLVNGTMLELGINMIGKRRQKV